MVVIEQKLIVKHFLSLFWLPDYKGRCSQNRDSKWFTINSVHGV